MYILEWYNSYVIRIRPEKFGAGGVQRGRRAGWIPIQNGVFFMNEVKTPKKPLISYYCIVILLLLLFNMLVMPMISQRQVKEVDYNTFMEMTYNDNIG